VSSPFRDATMSPAEVRRVLERAAKLAERDPETAKVERAMTRVELERAAADLGIPESAVARAIEHPDEEAEIDEVAKGSWFLGGKTRIVLERELPYEPTQAQREDILDDIRDVTGDVGTIESVGNTLVWHATQNRNATSTLSVRMRVRDGRTRVVIEERLLGQAIGLFVGMGVGGGIGPMGGYIALIARIGVVGLIAPLIWIPTMLIAARTIFSAMTKRRARRMHDIMRRIETHATSWQGTRVEPVAEKKRVDSKTDAEPLEEEETAAQKSAQKPDSGRTH
jgi:hypothetical protein